MKRIIPLLFFVGCLAQPVLAEPAPDEVTVTERESEPVLVAQADTAPAPVAAPTESAAPSESPSTTEQPAPAATVPDPIEQPAESVSILWQLYKAGHLIPMLIFAAFFVLAWLRKWIAWLRTGWRTLGVAAVLGALAMLAERAVEGTTPNLTMIVGAIGVALAMIINSKGEPKTDAAHIDRESFAKAAETLRRESGSKQETL